MATTGARGEGIIQAGDREVRVLFTMKAIAEIEAALGRNINPVLESFRGNDVGIGQTAILLRAGMEAHRVDSRSGGRAVGLDDAFQVLSQAGWTATLVVLMQAIAAVLSYGVETAQEPEAMAGGQDPNP